MKKVLVAIKDELRGFPVGVMVEDSEQTAYRNFAQLCNSDAAIKFKSTDYSLWVVGSWDTELGINEGCAPKLLVDASSCIRKETANG